MPPLPPPRSASKAAWRAWARSARDAARSDAGEAALREALRSAVDGASGRADGPVLAFLAFGGEPDLGPLLDAWREAGREVLVPRVLGPGRLALHRLEPASLVRHRWGMREPPAGARERDPAEVALALVPGLAFDRAGGRLGYGGGFYDRLLPRLRPGTPTIGVAFAAQVVPCPPGVPREAHDVRVGALATEGGLEPALPLPPERPPEAP